MQSAFDRDNFSRARLLEIYLLCVVEFNLGRGWGRFVESELGDSAQREVMLANT